MAEVEQAGVPEALMRQIAPIVAKYEDKPEMLMRMLLEVQEVAGNAIPRNVAAYLSRVTGMPEAKIFDFTRFYSMFSTSERGRYIVQMCDSAPCHVCGSAEVAEGFMTALGISKAGETSSDGMFTFEYCQCIGACEKAPAALIGDKVYANLTDGAAKNAITSIRSGVEV